MGRKTMQKPSCWAWTSLTVISLAWVIFLPSRCSAISEEDDNLNYIYDEEDAIEAKLHKRDRPDPDTPRPQVLFQPLINGAKSRATSDEPLDCNEERELYGGDEYIIKSVRYPRPSPKRHRCQWRFKVQAKVNTDLMCDEWHVPCEWENRVRVRTGRRRVSTLCSEPPENVYVDERIRLRTRKRAYTLRINHRTMTSRRGKGFSCVVRGTGGTLRPGPNPTPPPTTAPPTVPPTTAGCGIRSSKTGPKIVNGNFASPNEYPWMVALFIGRSFCGGSILNERWILTAAHCVAGSSPSSVFAYTGCHELTSSSCDGARPISLIVINKDYRGITNDIGMVRLSTPLSSFSSRVRPVCLPTRQTSPGLQMSTAGWGRVSDNGGQSSRLKEATLIAESDQTCRNTYGNGLSSLILCTRGDRGGSGYICSGDSGSFLGSERDGRVEQDGITSFGHIRSCVGYPMGFTEVYFYRDWIGRVYDAFP